MPDTAAPHAPERGRWIQRGGFLRFAHWAARRLPYAAGRAVAWTAAHGAWLALPGQRRAVARNLRALGRGGARKTFVQFALCQLDRHARLAGAHDVAAEFEGLDHWRAAADGGSGLLLVTAHVGHWEIGSALPVTQGRDVHVVREPEADPAAQREQERRLAAAAAPGYHTHFAADDTALGITLLRALREGAVVALQGDRPRAGGRTVDGALFGRPYALPAGVFALARGADVPLLPVFVLRDGPRKQRALFGAPIPVGRDPAPAAAAFCAALEAVLRRAPHQWFCWRDLWPSSGR